MFWLFESYIYTKFEICLSIKKLLRRVIESYSICACIDSRSNQELLIALKLVDVDLFNSWANNLFVDSIVPCRPGPGCSKAG